MKKEDRKQIEDLMEDTQCPKNFKCAELGFDHLCRARYLESENYLECLENPPVRCSFALRNGFVYVCQCPLRGYLARKLGKIDDI